MTKKFRNPVTGQLVVIELFASMRAVKITTEHKQETMFKLSQMKLDLEMVFRTEHQAELLFQRFNKDFAKALVSDPDNFKSFLQKQNIFV